MARQVTTFIGHGTITITHHEHGLNIRQSSDDQETDDNVIFIPHNLVEAVMEAMEKPEEEKQH